MRRVGPGDTVAERRHASGGHGVTWSGPEASLCPRCAPAMRLQGILNEADGIIISRGNLGLDCVPEKMALVQKTLVQVRDAGRLAGQLAAAVSLQGGERACEEGVAAFGGYGARGGESPGMARAIAGRRPRTQQIAPRVVLTPGAAATTSPTPAPGLQPGGQARAADARGGHHDQHAAPHARRGHGRGQRRAGRRRRHPAGRGDAARALPGVHRDHHLQHQPRRGEGV